MNWFVRHCKKVFVVEGLGVVYILYVIATKPDMADAIGRAHIVLALIGALAIAVVSFGLIWFWRIAPAAGDKED